MGKPKEAMYNR